MKRFDQDESGHRSKDRNKSGRRHELKKETSRDREYYRDEDREKEKEKWRRKNEDTEKAREKSGERDREHASTLEVQDQNLEMKEERLKKISEDVSEALAWVHRTRELEEKKRMFDEQENMVLGRGSEHEYEETALQQNTHNLEGMKVLHVLENSSEGRGVVLIVKDQNLLADGDINDELDMLETLEIVEQKRPDEASKVAKRKTGMHGGKFSDDFGSEKKILPQYDDHVREEGLTLEARGHFTGEAEKKLEEIHRRIQGPFLENKGLEDLSLSAIKKIPSDFYTHEEIIQFKRMRKKKSRRKKQKLDLDAIEAEAKAAGLGDGDLGSRKEGRRQAIREEKERSEVEIRTEAYQSAYAKADEATKSLRLEQTQTLPVKLEEKENHPISGDYEDSCKSLERSRKTDLKKKGEAVYGIEAIACLATSIPNIKIADVQKTANRELEENKLVITEANEFVLSHGLINEAAGKTDCEDIYADEDECWGKSEPEIKDEAGGWTEVRKPYDEDKKKIVPDETIHEVAIGKGLSGALKMLENRGELKQTTDEWGGRKIDKRKSKLIGMIDENADNYDDKFKDICIERIDEFGRNTTPKEAFRIICHKFHGQGPGKMKQEKRMKQYLEEMKLKQMENSDRPTQFVEKMREAQERMQTPYLVVSGNIKPWQIGDP